MRARQSGAGRGAGFGFLSGAVARLLRTGQGDGKAFRSRNNHRTEEPPLETCMSVHERHLRRDGEEWRE